MSVKRHLKSELKYEIIPLARYPLDQPVLMIEDEDGEFMVLDPAGDTSKLDLSEYSEYRSHKRYKTLREFFLDNQLDCEVDGNGVLQFPDDDENGELIEVPYDQYWKKLRHDYAIRGGGLVRLIKAEGAYTDVDTMWKSVY